MNYLKEKMDIRSEIKSSNIGKERKLLIFLNIVRVHSAVQILRLLITRMKRNS